jgi:hypothetical protein
LVIQVGLYFWLWTSPGTFGSSSNTREPEMPLPPWSKVRDYSSGKQPPEDSSEPLPAFNGSWTQCYTVFPT